MFKLDERLQNDTVLITDLPLCRVLLMNDSQFPWLILVPRIEGLAELHELDERQMQQYVQESRLCCKVLSLLYAPYKLNIAALGNVVRQLHIHHLCRYEEDIAWPAPVWGRQPAIPYGDSELAARIEALKNAFSTEEKR